MGKKLRAIALWEVTKGLGFLDFYLKFRGDRSGILAYLGVFLTEKRLRSTVFSSLVKF